MNNLPKIIIKDGYGIDESGNLNSVTMSDNVDMVATPTSVTTYASTINWIPSNSSTLTEFNAPNLTVLNNDRLFNSFTALQSISFDKLTSIVDNNNTYNSYNGTFSKCTMLTSINMPALESISDTNNRSHDSRTVGTFSYCISLENLYLPKLKTITTTGNTWSVYTGVFYNCTSLKTINLPCIQSMSNDSAYGAFKNCTGLKSITLGSYQHPVSAINANTFYGVTASDITVKIWTSDGNALANAPYGLTGVESITYYNSHYPEEEQND